LTIYALTNTEPVYTVVQGILPSATPVRARGVTNIEPACTVVQGILPYATPVRRRGVTNTEPAYTVVKGVLPSATLNQTEGRQAFTVTTRGPGSIEIL